MYCIHYGCATAMYLSLCSLPSAIPSTCYMHAMSLCADVSFLEPKYVCRAAKYVYIFNVSNFFCSLCCFAFPFFAVCILFVFCLQHARQQSLLAVIASTTFFGWHNIFGRRPRERKRMRERQKKREKLPIYS